MIPNGKRIKQPMTRSKAKDEKQETEDWLRELKNGNLWSRKHEEEKELPTEPNVKSEDEASSQSSKYSKQGTNIVESEDSSYKDPILSEPIEIERSEFEEMNSSISDLLKNLYNGIMKLEKMGKRSSKNNN